MRKALGTLIIILSSQVAFSQNFQTNFLKYCQTNDTINQLKVLTKWEAKTPKDPELFTSYFNYYFMKSRQEIVSLSTNQPEDKNLILKDSLNKTAGYLGSQVHYNQAELKKGFKKIDEGIKLYPNRLDMRFGKIYALGQILNWDRFTSEIIKTVKHSSTNNNNWIWTNNKSDYDGKNIFLLDIQNYQLQLYNTGSDKLLKNMRQIANEVLKYYPKHIPSLSNISITYLLTEEFDKGIKPLLKAEKLDPKDYIVLTNIAHGYKLKGDKQNAIEYYKKAAKYGDQKTKEFAEQQIIELKK